MALFKTTVSVLTLMAVIAAVACQQSQGGPHEDQGGPHKSQGRSRRQAPEIGPEEGADSLDVVAACANTTTTTSLSCYDCTTRLICKPQSIVLVKCQGTVRPFCNNGLCSSVLSPECA